MTEWNSLKWISLEGYEPKRWMTKEGYYKARRFYRVYLKKIRNKLYKSGEIGQIFGVRLIETND